MKTKELPMLETISKWKDVLNGYVAEEEESGFFANCLEYRSKGGYSCEGCPVEQEGFYNCTNPEYIAWAQFWNDLGIDFGLDRHVSNNALSPSEKHHAQYLAENEISFLIEIYEKYFSSQRDAFS